MSKRRLDLVKKLSSEVNSEPLRDMAKVAGRTAAIHANVHAHAHRTSHPSINSDRTPTTSRSPSRRSSRVEGTYKSPQIVIEPPHPEESLYPSLTTLGSFDDEEEEFSCRECCKAGMAG